jgi:glyoxylase-like metal-dependent hydrolase (beta-lactamase superfamily II)
MRIAPGIHRLGPGLVNSYLLVDGTEITIVDAGMPGNWTDLLAELASLGRSLTDVRAIVLTHGHSDHIGYAERARRDARVPVSIHELDAAIATGRAKSPSRAAGPIRLLPTLRFLLLGLRKGGLRMTFVQDVETFGDGATLDVPGAPRILLVPGHTPGSVALHVPSKAAIFAGDTLATESVMNGATGPMIAPFSEDPPLALRSLDRLDGLEADWLLPGHGQPWTGGVAEALRRIRAAGPDGMGRPHA